MLYEGLFKSKDGAETECEEAEKELEEDEARRNKRRMKDGDMERMDEGRGRGGGGRGGGPLGMRKSWPRVDNRGDDDASNNSAKEDLESAGSTSGLDVHLLRLMNDNF